MYNDLCCTNSCTDKGLLLVMWLSLMFVLFAENNAYLEVVYSLYNHQFYIVQCWTIISILLIF